MTARIALINRLSGRAVTGRAAADALLDGDPNRRHDPEGTSLVINLAATYAIDVIAAVRLANQLDGSDAPVLAGRVRVHRSGQQVASTALSLSVGHAVGYVADLGVRGDRVTFEGLSGLWIGLFAGAWVGIDIPPIAGSGAGLQLSVRTDIPIGGTAYGDVRALRRRANLTWGRLSDGESAAVFDGVDFSQRHRSLVFVSPAHDTTRAAETAFLGVVDAFDSPAREGEARNLTRLGMVEVASYRAHNPIEFSRLLVSRPFLVVSPSALSVREGRSGTLSVRLDSEPSGNVVVRITSDNGDVTVSPGTLTFRRSGPGIWSSNQSVTVAAGQDMDAEPEAASLTLSSDGVSGAVVVPVDVADDDVIRLVPSTRALVIEEGGSETLTVRLSHQPADPVTVDLDKSSTDITLSTAELVFSPNRWSIAQSVVVSAGNDMDQSDESETVTLSSDTGGIADVVVAITVRDDDVPPPPPKPEVSIAPVAASITEGAHAQFDVSIDTAPAGNLSVGLVVSALPSAQNYVAASALGNQSALIRGGDKTVRYSISTAGDSVDEPDGSVTVALRAGTAYDINSSAARATVSILDDDTTPAGPPVLTDTLWSLDGTTFDSATPRPGTAYPDAKFRVLSSRPALAETQVRLNILGFCASSGAVPRISSLFNDPNARFQSVSSSVSIAAGARSGDLAMPLRAQAQTGDWIRFTVLSSTASPPAYTGSAPVRTMIFLAGQASPPPAPTVWLPALSETIADDAPWFDCVFFLGAIESDEALAVDQAVTVNARQRAIRADESLGPAFDFTFEFPAGDVRVAVPLDFTEVADGLRIDLLPGDDYEIGSNAVTLARFPEI